MSELKNASNSKFTPVIMVIIAILLAIIAYNSSVLTYNLLDDKSPAEELSERTEKTAEDL